MSASALGRTFTDAEEGLVVLASVLDSSTEYSIIATDPEGVIVLWNEGARRLYGYEPAEIVGRPTSVLHTPEDVKAAMPEAMMDAARRHGEWHGMVQRVRQDGSAFTAWVVMTPRRGVDGTPGGFLVISSDVTADVELTTQRGRAEKRLHDVNVGLHDVNVGLHDVNVGLEAADVAKNRFLANMSHELRTPLNAIIGFTGTMLMELPGPLTDEQAKQLRTVQANGKHLLSIINDLLDLGRIESGKIELNIEPIGCRELTEEVVLGLRPLAEQKGIDMAGVAPEDYEVRSDRRSLSQILINLTNNAIKFTDEGTVRLEVSRRSENGASAIRFSVIDTGRGIDPKDQQKLFAAFEQIQASSAARHEGTGLGLYICQRLAVLIGGVITFESKLGEGSTFTLELAG
jgi:PAS domain S-box-containing protein